MKLAGLLWEVSLFSAICRITWKRSTRYKKIDIYNEVIINKLLCSYFVNFYSTAFLQLLLSREVIRLKFSIKRYGNVAEHQLRSIQFPSDGFVRFQHLMINNISVFEGFWLSFTRTVVNIKITVFEAMEPITARCFT